MSAQAYLSELKHLYFIASTETALEEVRTGKFPPLQKTGTVYIFEYLTNKRQSLLRNKSKHMPNKRLKTAECFF